LYLWGAAANSGMIGALRLPASRHGWCDYALLTGSQFTTSAARNHVHDECYGHSDDGKTGQVSPQGQYRKRAEKPVLRSGPLTKLSSPRESEKWPTKVADERAVGGRTW